MTDPMMEKAREWFGKCFHTEGADGVCENCLNQALREAVEGEREACAKVAKNHKCKTKWVDDLNNGDECVVSACKPNCETEIERAIRSRSNKEGR